MNACQECGFITFERKTVSKIFKYKGHSLVYQQPGNWCPYCEQQVLDESDVEFTAPVINNFKADIDGYLMTPEIKRIRKKLKLTQKQAGELFGGGHNAFSRYERGVARQPKSLDVLLRVLDRHPEHLEELRPRQRREVRLELV